MRSPHAKHGLMMLIIMLLLSVSSAQQRPSVSVGAHPFSGTLNVHATIPMFTTQDVQHSARLNVTYAFEGQFGTGVTYVLSDLSSTAYYTYVGAGIGAAFPQEPLNSPQFSVHAAAGVHVTISRNFGVFTEIIAAGNTLGSNLSAGIGLTYEFGRNSN